MYLIVGKKIDHSIIYKNACLGDSVILLEYKQNIAATFGGVASDYSFFALDATTQQRISREDEFDAVWENDEITGIDFSKENNRKLFTIRTIDPDNRSLVKDTMIGNNIDSIIIETKTCFPDETLDSSINGVALIPVIVPDERIVYLKVTITDGVGNDIVFKTNLEGIWSVVPTNIMVGSEKLRIWGVNGPGATNTINVLMNI